MKKLICFLLFAIAFVFAEDTEKNPWKGVSSASRWLL